MKIDIQDFDVDVRYSPQKDDNLIKINGDYYSLKQAYEFARKLQNVSNEIFDCLDRKIEDSLK